MPLASQGGRAPVAPTWGPGAPPVAPGAPPVAPEAPPVAPEAAARKREIAFFLTPDLRFRTFREKRSKLAQDTQARIFPSPFRFFRKNRVFGRFRKITIFLNQRPRPPHRSHVGFH